jgi:hypothetical protein
MFLIRAHWSARFGSIWAARLRQRHALLAEAMRARGRQGLRRRS